MERPNLKICIDNADSESDEEKPIIEDFIDDEESSESEEGELTSSKHSESELSYPSDKDEGGDDWGVETASTATLEVQMDHTKVHEPKRYENKDGEFQTGFDLLLKDYIKMRDKRGERFGIKDPPKTVCEEELKALYDSLGIKDNDLEHDSERGMRLETIHIRGVDNMSTKDVFQYFQGFSPGSLEWIDDTSCNVLWMEAVTAARALIHMSTPMETSDLSLEQKHRKLRSSTDSRESSASADKPDKDTESMDVDDAESVASKADSKVADNDEKASTTSKDSSKDKANVEDDFDYDLNLMSDDEDEKMNKDSGEKISEKSTVGGGTPAEGKAGEVKAWEDSQSQNGKEESGDEKADDMDVDSNAAVEPSKEAKQQLPPPPGRWRIGRPYMNKAEIIYMRYATKADKKVAGAEKRSHYYRKYGNPNYGGMKGLISGSKKRRILSSRYRQEEEEAKRMIAKSRRTRVPEEEEMTSFDEHMDSANKSRSKSQVTQRGGDSVSEEEVYSEEEEEVEVAEKEEEVSQLEEELRILLGNVPPQPKKRMRMYADDMEDQLKKKKADMSDTMEVHQGGAWDRLGDARSRIRGQKKDTYSYSQPTGGDLRQRLGRKRPADDRELQDYSDLPSLTVQVEPD